MFGRFDFDSPLFLHFSYAFSSLYPLDEKYIKKNYFINKILQKKFEIRKTNEIFKNH